MITTLLLKEYEKETRQKEKANKKDPVLELRITYQVKVVIIKIYLSDLYDKLCKLQVKGFIF